MILKVTDISHGDKNEMIYGILFGIFNNKNYSVSNSVFKTVIIFLNISNIE